MKLAEIFEIVEQINTLREKLGIKHKMEVKMFDKDGTSFIASNYDAFENSIYDIWEEEAAKKILDRLNSLDNIVGEDLSCAREIPVQLDEEFTAKFLLFFTEF